jgi:hypothetical protein
MENTLVKLLLTKWIELKSHGVKRIESLNELKNSVKFRYSLSKSSSGNDILGVEFYSPSRIEYSVNLNELINSKQ